MASGYKVYPCLIEDADHLQRKTAMTRVEGELAITALLGTTAPQNTLLLQICRDVESLCTIASLLFKTSTDSSFPLNHS